MIRKYIPLTTSDITRGIGTPARRVDWCLCDATFDSESAVPLYPEMIYRVDYVNPACDMYILQACREARGRGLCSSSRSVK